MKILTAAIFLAFSIGAAQAATLDFSGNICNGGNACGNGGSIDQSYGDIAGEVDVQFDGDRSTVALDSVYHWTGGYETLTHVAYTSSGYGMSILFQAATGFDVTLSAFDIATYFNRVTNTSIRIIDTATNSVLVNDTYAPLSTAGVTSYLGSWSSTDGILIEFGPDAWDVGISNLTYSAHRENTPTVPLPASGLLLGFAVFGLGQLRRKQS